MYSSSLLLSDSNSSTSDHHPQTSTSTTTTSPQSIPYHTIVSAIQTISFQGYETLSSTGSIQTPCVRPSLAQYQLYLSDSSLSIHQLIVCLEGINYCLWLGPYCSPRSLRPSAYNEAFRTLSAALTHRQLPSSVSGNISSSLPFAYHSLLFLQNCLGFHFTFNTLRLNSTFRKHQENNLSTTTSLSSSSISMLNVLPNQIINLSSIIRHCLLYRYSYDSSSHNKNNYPSHSTTSTATTTNTIMNSSLLTTEERIYHRYQMDILYLLRRLFLTPYQTIDSSYSPSSSAYQPTTLLNLPKLLEYFWAGAKGYITGTDRNNENIVTNSIEEHLTKLAYPSFPSKKQSSKGSSSSHTGDTPTAKKSSRTTDSEITEPTLPAPLSNVLAGAEDRLESESSSDDEDDEEERQEIAREAQEYRSVIATLLIYSLDEGTENIFAQHFTEDNRTLYTPLSASTVTNLSSFSAASTSYSLETMAQQFYVSLLDRYQFELIHQQQSLSITSSSPSQRPFTYLFPSVYQSTHLLRYVLAPIEVLLTEAAGAVQAVARYTTTSSSSSSSSPATSLAHSPDEKEITVPTFSSLLNASSITPSHIVYGLGMTALRVLNQLLTTLVVNSSSSPSLSSPPSTIVPWLTLTDTASAASVSSSSTTNDTVPSASASVSVIPFEIRLFQSLTMLLLHCPDKDYRSTAYRVFVTLLHCFVPSAKLQIITQLIENCPYPNITGILIDELRKSVLYTYRQVSSLSSSSVGTVSSCLLSPRNTSEVIMMIIHQRIQKGLLLPHTVSGEDTSRTIDFTKLNLYRANTIAQHLQDYNDIDSSVFSFLRSVLWIQKNTPVYQLFQFNQLILLRDSYLRPLMTAISEVQRYLRENEGIMALHPHPSPFPEIPSSSTPSEPTVSIPVTNSSSLTNKTVSTNSLLSQLFILEAALAPTLELLEDYTRSGEK